MTTTTGIVAPILVQNLNANVELIILATGVGSLVLLIVNDAEFWMVKEFFNVYGFWNVFTG
jgi:gluconate:H+ symporter, GntP family